ncbi:hypothetical protein [Hymenobacter volaticus]|uniref:Uncharacterized protein n=1 Tax=Hymenobacter volaticus TaxID=2932254 RepID=A0ABY4G222_9BACT|nr:hypothetical protein [Hymenobacter volaticus]UOQ64907.1 hypothetical protein MUN86_15210 [Hymenobacter volaticus]
MKVEIPHLLDINEFSGTRVVNSAVMTQETVSAAENRYFPPPSSLTLYLAGRGNQNRGLLTIADGTQITASNNRSQPAGTNLDQGTYDFSLTSYCTRVLNRQIDNNGILLAPHILNSPEQVVIVGSNHTVNTPRFSIYLTRV